MKKTIYSAVLLLLIGMAAISCKKEDKTLTETPMQKTILDKIVVDSVRAYSNNKWELGQKLYFSRDGKVTKLG